MATQSDITTVIASINTNITENANEEITGTIMNAVLLQVVNLIPPVVTGSLDNDDLDGSYEYEVEHNLNTSFPLVWLMDGSNKIAGPANVDFVMVDANTIKFAFHGEITGTWYYKISKDD